MSEKPVFKTIPCKECGIPLKAYYLKDGVCYGCRNPHLIVTAVVEETETKNVS